MGDEGLRRPSGQVSDRRRRPEVAGRVFGWSPLGLTVRQYFVFDDEGEHAAVGDDLLRPEVWDALRVETSGLFALPATRERLEAILAAHTEIIRRARRIDEVLSTRGIESVASYAVGAALVETELVRLAPERRWVLTEYAPETVGHLRVVLPETSVVAYDLLREPPLPADVQLFHRLDGTLSNSQWHNVFRRFRRERVLFVSSGVIRHRSALAALGTRPRRRRQAGVRAGWLRTRGAYQALWSPTHEQEPIFLHDLDAWWLEPRRSR